MCGVRVFDATTCASATTSGDKKECTIKYPSDVEGDVDSAGEARAKIIHITYSLREEEQFDSFAGV